MPVQPIAVLFESRQASRDICPEACIEGLSKDAQGSSGQQSVMRVVDWTEVWYALCCNLLLRGKASNTGCVIHRTVTNSEMLIKGHKVRPAWQAAGNGHAALCCDCSTARC